MTDQGWPGPTAARATAPVESRATAAKSTRMEMVHRIAELMGRYRPALIKDKWRLLDMENAGEAQAPTYGDEDSARAGARLMAGYDIYDLFVPKDGGQ